MGVGRVEAHLVDGRQDVLDAGPGVVGDALVLLQLPQYGAIDARQADDALLGEAGEPMREQVVPLVRKELELASHEVAGDVLHDGVGAAKPAGVRGDVGGPLVEQDDGLVEVTEGVCNPGERRRVGAPNEL